jgi:hypothetical protein
VNPETYTLTLRPIPSDVPTALRLRKLLKFALRGCALRCTGIQQNGTASASADTETTDTPVEP